MKIIVLFFTDPSALNSRREFRGLFANKAAAEQWIEYSHGTSIANDAWLQSAYTFVTETVIGAE